MDRQRSATASVGAVMLRGETVAPEPDARLINTPQRGLC